MTSVRSTRAGAEQAMIDDLTEVVLPGTRVLDADCGFGTLARRLRQLQPRAEPTLLVELPAANVVVSGWVIETVPDPARAVREYLRVLRPGGRVLYTFCSLPDGWLSRAGSAVRRGFAGDFIPIERAPFHDCTASHRLRFRGGLTTEVSLSSCCHVAPYVLPARP